MRSLIFAIVLAFAAIGGIIGIHSTSASIAQSPAAASSLTIIASDGGEVVINGVRLKGKSISVMGGKVFVDGVEQTLGADDKPLGACQVQVQGNVESFYSVGGDVNVSGNAHSIQTVSGNVRAGDVAGNVVTTSGAVTADKVQGSVSSVAGQINACKAF